MFEELDIFEISAITITVIALGTFFLVQLNEIRLEARILIYDEINERGKDQLLSLEKQFANKLISMSVNDRSLTFDDLDQIFLNYLSDNQFLPNLSKLLESEILAHKAFKFCPGKTAELEAKIVEWAKGDITNRIPKRFFSKNLKDNWKYRVLMFTRRNFFTKRAENFLIEVKQGVAEVAERHPSQPEVGSAY